MTKLFIPVRKNDSFDENYDVDLHELYVEKQFGRTPYYLLADLKTKEWNLIQNTNHHFGGKDTPVSIAREQNADLVLASHIGYGPYTAFKKHNIPVLQTISNNSIQEILKGFNINEYDEIIPPAKGSCCSSH